MPGLPRELSIEIASYLVDVDLSSMFCTHKAFANLKEAGLIKQARHYNLSSTISKIESTYAVQGLPHDLNISASALCKISNSTFAYITEESISLIERKADDFAYEFKQLLHYNLPIFDTLNFIPRIFKIFPLTNTKFFVQCGYDIFDVSLIHDGASNTGWQSQPFLTLVKYTLPMQYLPLAPASIRSYEVGRNVFIDNIKKQIFTTHHNKAFFPLTDTSFLLTLGADILYFTQDEHKSWQLSDQFTNICSERVDIFKSHSFVAAFYYDGRNDCQTTISLFQANSSLQHLATFVPNVETNMEIAGLNMLSETSLLLFYQTAKGSRQPRSIVKLYSINKDNAVIEKTLGNFAGYKLSSAEIIDERNFIVVFNDKKQKAMLHFEKNQRNVWVTNVVCQDFAKAINYNFEPINDGAVATTKQNGHNTRIDVRYYNSERFFNAPFPVSAEDDADLKQEIRKYNAYLNGFPFK